MITSFKELVAWAKGKGTKTCVVVKAEDETVLEGIRMAHEAHLVTPILIGNKSQIHDCAHRSKLNVKNVEIHDIDDDKEAMKHAISILKQRGHFLMKGMLSTTSFLKGILDKDFGLRAGHILSHIAVLEIPGYHKLLFMSDGGMNPRLDLTVRIEIIKNALAMLRHLRIHTPKIALIAASEAINPDMPETTDAVQIVELNRNGTLRDCIIEGPFGFDVAISRKAAEHKKLQSEIAGDTDFLLMPNISAANIWAKGLIYFAHAKSAGMVAGASKPVIMLSRADTPETKLHSIALGVAISENNSST